MLCNASASLWSFLRLYLSVCVRTQTVLHHTARRRPKWTQTPCDGFGQAETTHTKWTHTTNHTRKCCHTLSHIHIHVKTHTHTNTHLSTSWPNYTEMRNEMETNLPREPANLEELKDTLTYFCKGLLHTNRPNTDTHALTHRLHKTLDTKLHVVKSFDFFDGKTKLKPPILS